MMVPVPGLSDKAYVDDPSAILGLFVLCPVCLERDGVEHGLVKDGRYPRYVPVGLEWVLSWIYRRYCSGCGTSFSLFPAFVLFRMSYGRSLVVSWLWACLQGASCRDRAFLEQHGMVCPTCDGRTSWSDLLDISRARPGYQLLWRWTTRFSELALQEMPRLVTAFVAHRCNLRLDLAAWLTPVRHLRPRAYPLAIALGLWRGLLEASRTDGRAVSLEHALSSLVEYLLQPSDAASHGLRRAPAVALDYAVCSQVGRAPPASTV